MLWAAGLVASDRAPIEEQPDQIQSQRGSMLSVLTAGPDKRVTQHGGEYLQYKASGYRILGSKIVIVRTSPVCGILE